MYTYIQNPGPKVCVTTYFDIEISQQSPTSKRWLIRVYKYSKSFTWKWSNIVAGHLVYFHNIQPFFPTNGSIFVPFFAHDCPAFFRTENFEVEQCIWWLEMVGIMKVLLFMKGILQAGDNHNQSGVHFGKLLMDQVGGAGNKVVGLER